ncbi:hypothetical protein [Streptomyces sp. NPDC004783]|uniref:hypothetical protein n=1 Tax=Streptomyces sp. NPDC004783 TaxID=3154459 RepID=UPI0033A88AC7
MPQTWPEDRREAVCAWLRANGVDPDNVPRDGDLYLESAPDGDPYTGRYLHYEAFHLNSDGLRHLDERGDGPVIERRRTLLLVDPPAWWEPYRKPTRDQLLHAIARVHALHRRNENTRDCEHCSERDYPDYAVRWPCPTIRALGVEVQP